MILVYSSRITYRLSYAMDLMLRELLGLEHRITKDEQEFLQFEGPKLSYHDKPLSTEPFFYATTLLFERGIKPQEISVFDWEDSKAFFATHPRFLMPFDPFAAAFYLVTRYEEYLPHQRDAFDRFEARESLAFKKGFLHQAVVNRWAKRIGEVLQAHFPDLNLPERKYKYVSTIDIDNAWAFREKGLLRTCGALLKSAVRLDLPRLRERIAVLVGRERDPYDTYDELDRIRSAYDLTCIYFFLLGDYSQHDRNVSPSRRAFRSLIKSIADYNTCGIHPSFLSNDEPQRLLLEQSRLSKIIRRDISISRQHFLRMRFPDTYRQLIGCDITEDHTMGYAQEIGFRASICSPYYFYDLGSEQETTLRIHPFAVMDTTLRHYLRLRPDEVMARVLPLIREVKSLGGTFITLWHNESLSDFDPWRGWRPCYEQIVKVALP